MPWTAQGGFGSDTPWLPFGKANLTRSVEAQEADANSLLHHTRAMIALRVAHPALHHGAVADCRAEDHLLTFIRETGEDRISCAFNLSAQTITAPELPASAQTLLALNGADAGKLPPFAARIAKL